MTNTHLVGSNSVPHGNSGIQILPSCHLVMLLSSRTLSSGQSLFRFQPMERATCGQGTRLLKAEVLKSQAHTTAAHVSQGFPGGSAVPTCQCRRLRFDPGQEDSLEKGMATHSSILAWRIPWTEEPGGLQSMVSQRFALD